MIKKETSLFQNAEAPSWIPDIVVNISDHCNGTLILLFFARIY